jgi:flagellar biosynthesis/type III secretory pathway protein FliH
MRSFNHWFKSTFSFILNYYSDYEDAYDEGYGSGYEEGLTEGFISGKSEGQLLWKDMYRFLQDRHKIDPYEEVTHFDLMERLLEYEKDLKGRNDRNEDNM